jgi:hypothetical protein
LHDDAFHKELVAAKQVDVVWLEEGDIAEVKELGFLLLSL